MNPPLALREEGSPVHLQRQAQSEKLWLGTNGRFTLGTNMPQANSRWE